MIVRLTAENSRFNKMSAILPEADFFATVFFCDPRPQRTEWPMPCRRIDGSGTGD